MKQVINQETREAGVHPLLLRILETLHNREELYCFSWGDTLQGIEVKNAPALLPLLCPGKIEPVR